MGMRRGRRSGEPTYHAGMDMSHTGGRGTPVYNVTPGTVERVLNDDGLVRGFGGYGNGVIVYHPQDDTWSLYAHLDRTTVSTGQKLRAGDQVGTMGNSSNGKFRGMGVHLHLELRKRRPNGARPFPGPYRHNNLDPRPWLSSKGLEFSSRGAFQVRRGSAMEAMAGVDPYPLATAPGGSLVPETAMAGSASDGEVNTYEPPASFDRDVRFGLTPTEWGAVGAGSLVLTAGAVALFVRSRRS